MDQDKMEELLIRIDEGLNGKNGLHIKVDTFQKKFQKTLEDYLPTWLWAKSAKTWVGRISLTAGTAGVMGIIYYFMGIFK